MDFNIETPVRILKSNGGYYGKFLLILFINLSSIIIIFRKDLILVLISRCYG